MSNSKQNSSEVPAQADLEQASIHNANGKENEDQLVNEVSKLDQIRDMLFGEHVATLQNSYQSLDKSLEESVAELRKELTSSIAELKNQIDKNFDQLQKKILSEEQERATQNEGLANNLANVNSDILTKIDLEAKRMDQVLIDQHQESTRQLNSMVDSLQEAKVDRKSLAGLFSQVAKELEGS